jgi:nitroreductase
VQATIAARRSVRQFVADPVPRPLIERLLDAAVQAPNHRRTAPWRFFVVDRPGALRDQLADLACEAALGRGGSADDPGVRTRAEAKRQEILATPVLLFVYSVPGRDPEVTRENYAAVACAVQNLMLAAVEEGLASGWSTGGVARHTRLPAVLGAGPDWELVAMVYLGRATAAPPPSAPRPNAAQFTRWLSDS